MSASERAPANVPVLAKCLVALALFSAWPLLNFANQNREQLDAGGVRLLVSSFVATALAGWLAFFVLHLLSKGRRTIAACASVCLFLVLFFSYHLIYDALVATFEILGLSRGENFAYAAIVLALCLACLFLVRNESVLQLLLIFGAIVTLIPGFQFFVFSMRGTSAPPTLESETSLPPIVDRRNVFHFIADSYPRQDALSRFVDFDNTEFVRALEARGFFVAPASYSNYPATFLSIPSTMSMRYPVTEQTNPFETRESFYDVLAGANPVVEHVLQHDYRYIHQGSVVWDGSRCGGREDTCLSTGRAFQVALVDLTPLRRFLKSQRPSTVADIAAHVDEIFAGRKPVFLFSHTMPPHPPRTFSARCTELRVTDRQAPLRDFWGDRDGYRNDLSCVNEQFLGVVDSLLERDPDAVILFHGDHGSAFGVDWSLALDAWSEEQLEERLSIMLAVRLPERCANLLYPTISPINLYPTVFACLGRVEPVLQPDTSYVSPHEKHPQYGTAHRYRSSNPGGAP